MTCLVIRPAGFVICLLFYATSHLIFAFSFPQWSGTDRDFSFTSATLSRVPRRQGGSYEELIGEAGTGFCFSLFSTVLFPWVCSMQGRKHSQPLCLKLLPTRKHVLKRAFFVQPRCVCLDPVWWLRSTSHSKTAGRVRSPISSTASSVSGAGPLFVSAPCTTLLPLFN